MRAMTARDRSRSQLDAAFEAERRRMTADHSDVDACKQLWRTVLQRTVDDLLFLRRTRDRNELKKHEQERLRRIHENPPAEFVRGAWFEQICDYLQVNPERLRRAILKLEVEAA